MGLKVRDESPWSEVTQNKNTNDALSQARPSGVDGSTILHSAAAHAYLMWRWFARRYLLATAYGNSILTTALKTNFSVNFIEFYILPYSMVKSLFN